MSEIKYKVIGGTSYHEQTPDSCCKALERARKEDLRVKLYQGDVETGRLWAEEWDTIGYIGRSTGTNKIPLLLAGKLSHGGGGLLDHCLLAVKDMETGKYLYKSKLFTPPVVQIVESKEPGYKYSSLFNGELHGNHKTLDDAQQTKWILEGACVPDMETYEKELEAI